MMVLIQNIHGVFNLCKLVIQHIDHIIASAIFSPLFLSLFFYKSLLIECHLNALSMALFCFVFSAFFSTDSVRIDAQVFSKYFWCSPLCLRHHMRACEFFLFIVPFRWSYEEIFAVVMLLLTFIHSREKWWFSSLQNVFFLVDRDVFHRIVTILGSRDRIAKWYRLFFSSHSRKTSKIA